MKFKIRVFRLANCKGKSKKYDYIGLCLHLVKTFPERNFGTQKDLFFLLICLDLHLDILKDIFEKNFLRKTLTFLHVLLIFLHKHLIRVADRRDLMEPTFSTEISCHAYMISANVYYYARYRVFPTGGGVV